MSDFDTTVSSIEYNVRRLIEENATLRAKVEEQHAKCLQLQEALNNQYILTSNLEEKNKLLTLGNTLAQKGDSTDIKLKINQLIRTIDKSLALLTKME